MKRVRYSKCKLPAERQTFSFPDRSNCQRSECLWNVCPKGGTGKTWYEASTGTGPSVCDNCTARLRDEAKKRAEVLNVVFKPYVLARPSEDLEVPSKSRENTTLLIIWPEQNP